LRVSTEILNNAIYDSDWYFCFRLCLAFWKNAYVGHRSFLLIARGKSAAVLQLGALRGSVASEMEEEVSAAGKHHEASDEAVISGLLDPDLAKYDLQDA
jgi:hypothetical protein